MKIKQFKTGDWIFDINGELKQIVSTEDGMYTYTDGITETTASGYTSCWKLSIRNLLLAQFLKKQRDKVDSVSGFRNRLVREKFKDFAERLFNLPYGKRNITSAEVKQCENLYKEIEDYVKFLIKQNEIVKNISSLDKERFERYFGMSDE